MSTVLGRLVGYKLSGIECLIDNRCSRDYRVKLHHLRILQHALETVLEDYESRPDENDENEQHQDQNQEADQLQAARAASFTEALLFRSARSLAVVLRHRYLGHLHHVVILDVLH